MSGVECPLECIKDSKSFIQESEGFLLTIVATIVNKNVSFSLTKEGLSFIHSIEHSTPDILYKLNIKK